MNKQQSQLAARAAFASGCTTFLAGAWLCWLLPDRLWAWLPVMLAMPLAWLIVRRLNHAKTVDTRGQYSIAASMALAGMMLTLSMLAVIAEHLNWFQTEPGELSKRVWGVIMGAIVVVYANLIPKQAASAERARLLRFCGWALVLGGLAHALVWLLCPLAYANAVAIGVLLTALAIIGLRLLGLGGPRSAPPRPSH